MQKRLRFSVFFLVLIILSATYPRLAFSLPATFDWRNNGGNYVTPIENQGSCGDCWAFSTTAAMESKNLITAGKPEGLYNIDLSEQFLLSCSNAGTCAGGYIDQASNYIRDNGLPFESCISYTGAVGACPSGCSDFHKISGWSWISQVTVDSIKNDLYTYGPIVATFAVYDDFYSYSGGIYSYQWGNYEGDHAVLVVGYDDNNQCFIVKNSWGPNWGGAGYFRIAYSQVGSSPVYFGTKDGSIYYGNTLNMNVQMGAGIVPLINNVLLH